ncbi:RNA polymerase sigma-70 factor (ECF subfamily) [Chitinophaga sp. W2I13]|uniref:RNA polymerase sigma factor SigZ n=1 Tax=Chitinophaga sp. W2I13 TaxID=3373923 RepID=UPI003D1E2940
MQPTHISIWEEFSTELKRFICQKVNQGDHCNDILQDVYLKIFINIGKIEKAQHIRAYLYRIANNAVTDYYRRTRENIAIDAAPVMAEDHEVFAEEHEYRLADCLRPMIESLPQIYREALVFTELEGLTQQQFAGKMGISLSGAKSRVQRAREKLKEEIIRCCEYEFDKYGNILACCKNSPPGKNYCASDTVI